MFPAIPDAWRVWFVRLGGLLIAIAISLLIILERNRLAALSEYGYLGVFLVGIVSSATVLFPAPGMVVTFAAGDVLNPFLVGIAAGAGEAIGELVGYLAGSSGRAIVENRALYQSIVLRMRQYGTPVLFILSAIPNPTFDLVGIAAGALGFPVWRFLVVCAAGKILKSIVVALAGARLMELLPW